MSGWRSCWNCRDGIRGACLCFPCLRAVVVTAVLTELIAWCFR